MPPEPVSGEVVVFSAIATARAFTGMVAGYGTLRVEPAHLTWTPARGGEGWRVPIAEIALGGFRLTPLTGVQVELPGIGPRFLRVSRVRVNAVRAMTRKARAARQLDALLRARGARP